MLATEEKYINKTFVSGWWYDINVAGGLAQLGERLVRNQKVTGSNPVFSTI